MDVPRIFGFGTATLAFQAAGAPSPGVPNARPARKAGNRSPLGTPSPSSARSSLAQSTADASPLGTPNPGSAQSSRIAPAVPDLLATEITTDLGGTTANTLVQLSRLGLHATWLGKLGNDWIGQRILDGLEEEGVDCDSVLCDAALCSPFHLALPDAPVVRLPNSLAQLQLPELEYLAGQVNPGDWVLVEIGELPLPLVSTFCAQLRRREARLALAVDLDPILQIGADPVDLQMLLAHPDLLIPNPQAIRPLCETDNPEAMAADLARRYHCVAVLRTPEGAWYAAPSGLGEHLPADLADPIDPSGSEAAFRGGLLAALAQDQGLPAALRLGNHCALRTAAQRGPRTGMPRAAELALDDLT